MLQLQQQLDHLQGQHNSVTAERDNLVVDLKEARAVLKARGKADAIDKEDVFK